MGTWLSYFVDGVTEALRGFGDWPWKLGLTPGLFVDHTADSLGCKEGSRD